MARTPASSNATKTTSMRTVQGTPIKQTPTGTLSRRLTPGDHFKGTPSRRNPGGTRPNRGTTCRGLLPYTGPLLYRGSLPYRGPLCYRRPTLYRGSPKSDPPQRTTGRDPLYWITQGTLPWDPYIGHLEGIPSRGPHHGSLSRGTSQGTHQRRTT